MIFASDFAQLPPVRDCKLYGRITDFSMSQHSQDQVSGKLLWLSIDMVVILHKIWRQKGSENASFVELLEHLHIKPDWLQKPWSTMPVIVPQNNVKDAFNEHMAHRFAEEHGRELHYYYALDSHKRLPITDHALQDHLYSVIW
ncbi:hypothetical protein F5146DRAFT_938344 [Armillaria mellea]|nr:hypothetical protein F5146DRAFT_938344 [Armillaria mellea]